MGSGKSGIVIFSASARPASSLTQLEQDISRQAVYKGSRGVCVDSETAQAAVSQALLGLTEIMRLDTHTLMGTFL